MSEAVLPGSEGSHARRRRASPRGVGVLEAMDLPPRVTGEIALFFNVDKGALARGCFAHDRS